jgi:hypothetical protein
MNSPAMNWPASGAMHGRSMITAPEVAVPWSQGARISIGLWLFVLLFVLPVLVTRHSTDSFSSVALDSSTILVSMALGMLLFAVFRASARWAQAARWTAWAAGVFTVVVVQTVFDLLFTGWVAANLDASWAALPVNLGRAWESGFKYLLVFSVNLALFQLALAQSRSLAQERQIVAIRSTAQQAQIAALRYQVNPHFLFNTLNAISSLIVARRNEEAEQVVNQLSAFLRSTATIRPNDMIALDEELSFVEQYLEIEGVRFGDRLAPRIDCARDAGRRMVPALILQTLVMCAVDYAVSLTREQVLLSIDARVSGDLLVIATGTMLPAGVTGATEDIDRELDSAEARLKACYGDRASLTRQVDGDRFGATITIAEA